MSKKLIAVASAAALALSAFVAMPATAAAATITVDAGSGTVSGATAKSGAATSPNAAENNQLTWGSTGTTVRFTVSNPLAASANITVNSDLGVKVLTVLTDADDKALKVGAGSTSVTGSDSTATNDFVFYAYTTSTTAGTVAINMAGNTTVYWVKGTAGQAYSLASVVFPTSVVAKIGQTETKDVISFVITDVFGNKLENAATAVDVSALGASVSDSKTVLGSTADQGKFSATKKVYEAFVYNATSSNVAMSLKVNTDADFSADGLAAPVDTAFSSVSAGSLADQVKALTAQVASLTAQLAASRPVATSVTKKKYNTLARKWNAANPSNKVALKK
jgi:hypothetical protein